MIENEKQYQAAGKKVDQIVAEIGKIKKSKGKHPIRNRLILAGLNNFRKEIETEMVLYESLRKNKI
jgi:hypothetical protein